MNPPNWLRVGDRLVNPAHIAMLRMNTGAAEIPVWMAGSAEPIWARGEDAARIREYVEAANQ